MTYGVAGLEPQTVYHFQIKASNINDGERESDWARTDAATLGALIFIIERKKRNF